MGADQNHDWEAAIASALEWWRDAGVDMLTEETPRDWLAPPSRVPDAPAGEPAPAPTALPATLEAFATWRVSAAAPESGWGGPLIAAEGPAGAELMVLVEMPEREDSAVGKLLSGANGRLLDAMLRAIGRRREDVQLAAVAISRPATGRIAPEAAEALAKIARHQLSLAKPKAVLLFGNSTRAILGQECASARGVLHAVNHDGGKTVAVASFHPRTLIEKPQLKAEAWRDLQMLAKALSEDAA